MIELVPFTEQDVDRLISWIASPEELFVWTADRFAYPLTREAFREEMRRSAERETGCSSRRSTPSPERWPAHRAGRDRSAQPLAADRPGPARAGLPRARPGTVMTRAALDLAFGTFAVHRVELGVFDTNPRAQACYERVGFQVEGTRRESILATPGVSPEGYWNVVTMSILDREWEALRTA